MSGAHHRSAAKGSRFAVVPLRFVCSRYPSDVVGASEISVRDRRLIRDQKVVAPLSGSRVTGDLANHWVDCKSTEPRRITHFRRTDTERN